MAVKLGWGWVLIAVRVFAAGLLAVAIWPDHSYSYFQVLRLVVFGVAALFLLASCLPPILSPAARRRLWMIWYRLKYLPGLDQETEDRVRRFKGRMRQAAAVWSSSQQHGTSTNAPRSEAGEE